MKIRIGFISNSSASSFCVFGWTKKTLLKKDETNTIDNVIKMIKEKDDSLSPFYFHGNMDRIVGVGTFDDEIDHGNEDWESFESDGPSEEEVDKLKEVAKKLGLPEPEWYSETWFNG